MKRLLFGFDLTIHWSVFLVPVIIAVAGYTAKMPIDDVLILILGLPLSILFHELAHCFTARRMGVKVKEIEMTVYGCCAEIDWCNTTNRQEALISLSGPIMSVALSLIVFPVNQVLSALNFLIALINLLPAYPFDGGRVLKAGLSLKLPKEKAERITLYPSLLLIGVLLTYGLYKISEGNYLNGILVSTLGAYIFSIIYEEKVSKKKKCSNSS